MIRYEIIPEKSAFIVFDMINEFLAEGYMFAEASSREIVPRIKEVIDAFRKRNMLIVYACQTHRRDGSDLGRIVDVWPIIKEGEILKEGTKGVDVYGELAPQQGDIIIRKHRYSAFYGTDLEIILKGKGIDTLIISGVSTNIGCETTARDAVVRDYKVIFLADGTSTGDIPDLGWGEFPRDLVQKMTLSNLARAFCEVSTVKEVLQRINEQPCGKPQGIKK